MYLQDKSMYVQSIVANCCKLLLALQSPDESAKHAFNYVPYMVNRLEILWLKKGVTGDQAPPPSAEPTPQFKLLAPTVQKKGNANDFEEISFSADDASKAMKKNASFDDVSALDDKVADNVPITPTDNTIDANSSSNNNPTTPQDKPVEVVAQPLQAAPIQTRKYLDFAKFTALDFQKFIFIHVWGFCASMSVVEACQKKAFELDTDTLRRLCKSLGDLYSFSQFQVRDTCFINLSSCNLFVVCLAFLHFGKSLAYRVNVTLQVPYCQWYWTIRKSSCHFLPIMSVCKHS